MRFMTLALLLFASHAWANLVDPAGTYWTPEQDAHITVYTEEGLWYGRISWAREPRKDEENDDPALRDRDVVGLVMIDGFTRGDDGRFEGGTVYAPDDGKTYQGRFWLDDNGNLKLRGFVGISLFGRTATLRRIPDGQVEAARR